MGFLYLLSRRLFNPLKSNFARIAENTTKYYLELKNNYGDKFSDEASLLATAGVLDAGNYIFPRKEATLTVTAVQRMASEAICNRSRLSDQEKDLLSEFVTLLEIELFTLDNPYFSRSDIIAACYKKVDTITRAVQKTLKRYTRNKLFALVTVKFMESPEFQQVRKQLGIKD